jgi:M6 family metalloprotease-like protein
MRITKTIVFSLIFAFLDRPALALRHVIEGTYPNAAQCQVKYVPRSVGTNGVQAATLTNFLGTKNIAVIVVQFPAGDGSLISGSRSIVSLGNIDTYFSQMAAFYSENSYTKMTLQFRFFSAAANSATAVGAGAVTLAQPSEYYGCGDEGIGCSGVTTPRTVVPSANGDYLIRDALNAVKGANPTLTSTNYDGVIVLHAGNGNETTTGAKGDIWSITYAQSSVISSAGLGFDSGMVAPETESSGITSPLGVMCHEFGHELGLPDLYNTVFFGGSSVVGDWDLMDSGPYGSNGGNPSHMGAWMKYTLGWATPQTITTRTNATINLTATNANGMLRIPIQNGSAQEYFLVEYRSKTAPGATYDKDIPGTGLVVWHIDDAIALGRSILNGDPNSANTVNSGVPHFGVSIVTADGASISSTNQGQATNAFQNNSILTSPKSDNFAGTPSGVSLVNIAGVGGSAATLEVVNLAVGSSQRITRAANYPNPAGKGYAHARGEGFTTIQFQAARPGQEYEINIYTVSGDLVKKIPKGDITLNIDRSADEKWVYEYTWNLTNGEGRHVAPGVYFYLMRIDGETKTGKAVIIR